MGKFVASKKVERIEWDFTGVPKLGGKDGEEVGGDFVIGTLPEPDPDAAGEFIEQYQEMIADALDSAREVNDRVHGGKPDEDDADAFSIPKGAYKRLHGLSVTALETLGVPRSLLDQLPPRFVASFIAHVADELSGEGVAAS